MLDVCAPGHTRDLTDHFWVIRWRTRTYWTFPKHKEIQLGHVRKMIRHLEINMECAKENLKVLQG